MFSFRDLYFFIALICLNSIIGLNGFAAGKAKLNSKGNSVAEVNCTELLTGESFEGDSDRKARVAKAKALVRRQEQYFDTVIKSTGYPSYEKFVAALKSIKNPKIQELISIFEMKKLEVVIQADGAREGIFTDGLLNQHSFENRSSGGADDKGGRNIIESRLLFQNTEDYTELDPKIKGKYGYFRPKQRSTGNLDIWIEENVPYAYDHWILKMSKIQDRLTWHPSDSYDRLFIPMLDLRDYHGYQGGEKLFKPSSWDSKFIPWKYRMLMVPLAVPKYLEEGTLIPSIVDLRYIRKETGLAKFNFDIRHNGYDRTDPVYFESEVFGDIMPEDIEAFEFTNSDSKNSYAGPPSMEFEKKLRDAGIKILDGSKDPLHPVLWKR